MCVCAGAVCCFMATAARAQRTDSTRADSVRTILPAVTAIGSRSDIADTRRAMAKVPGGVAMITPQQIQSTRQANLKDVLEFTPGVYVQPRFGAADESQISIRGSGLQNNFHARGVNLLVNGMPYRNADGFTDFESLELLTTEAIEVYKGANALRYGGSTLGGAIDLDTKTGYTASPFEGFVEGGGYGFQKEQLASGGVRGGLDYYASFAHTGLGGYRDWAANTRDRLNLHTGWKLSPTTDARLFYFYARVNEELPGSLTAAQFATDPQAADPANASDHWGRHYDLDHVGLQLRSQLSANQRIEVSPYLQYRDIDHPIYQVLAQVSHDWGAEVRYENTAPVGGLSNRLTLGVQPAYETLHNRQFVNDAGHHGALTRNEQDLATTLAAYGEDALTVAPRLTAVVGARADRSTRRVRDDFLSDGDQSADRDYTAITPRLGILYMLDDGAQVYANASRTVEPPLFLELTSYHTNGGFVDLAAQDAWQYEIGTRRQHLGLGWDVSLYDIELRNEILNENVLLGSGGGAVTVPTYRNAPRTRHYGAEVGLAYRLPGHLLTSGGVPDAITTRLAYTYGRFTYVADPQYAGNEIPGAPSHYLAASAEYRHPSGLTLTPVVEWVPRPYFVNSANTVTNDAWASLSMRVEYAVPGRGVTVFASGRNLTDARYSQSVQVDNAAGKFYEPADARSFAVGLRWSR
jgi:iron complex outermembrane receptor protein